MSDMVVYLEKAASVLVGPNGTVDIRLNLNDTPENELVELRRTRDRKGNYKNTVKVYAGPKSEFKWAGDPVQRMAISDFNEDGFRDIVYHSDGSDSGMMLTYDKKTNGFLLVPVKVERARPQ